MDLYVTYYSADFLTRVNLDTLTRVGALDLAPGGGGDDTVDCIVIGDYLYMARDGAIADEIVKIHLPTFSEVARLDLSPWATGTTGYPHSSFAHDDNYLYYAMDRPLSAPGAGSVARINLATFTYVDEVVLARRWPCIIRDGNNLYAFPGVNGGPQLQRIDLTTFTVAATIILTNGIPLAKEIVGNFLYLGRSTVPAAVTRVDLATFLEGPTIVFPPGEDWCWSMISDGTYLYCGLASAPGNPGIIVRVDIATFTYVDSLILPIVGPWLQAEIDIWNLYIDNNYLWALCESAPANVVQVDILTFTRVAGLKLNVGEDDSWAGGLWLPPAPPAPPTTPYRVNRAFALSREEL